MRVQLKTIIPPVFWPVHQAIRRGAAREVVAKGGRGSGKSSYLSVELVYQLLRHPRCHAVVLRKVAGTLRNSVYNQVVWAIGQLGCARYFRCTVSPMECTYLPTGQKILFFGLDDAGKLKSIKVPFGSVGLCWFEELDQFDGPEEVRNVEQSILRGGDWTLTLKSFNPPAMAPTTQQASTAPSSHCSRTAPTDTSTAHSKRAAMVTTPASTPRPKDSKISTTGSTSTVVMLTLPLSSAEATPKEAENSINPTASSMATTNNKSFVMGPSALYWRTTIRVAAGAVAEAIAPRVMAEETESSSGRMK